MGFICATRSLDGPVLGCLENCTLGRLLCSGGDMICVVFGIGSEGSTLGREDAIVTDNCITGTGGISGGTLGIKDVDACGGLMVLFFLWI